MTLKSGGWAEPAIGLVTGARDGIGLAIVRRLLQRPGIEKLFATTREPALAPELRQLAAGDERVECIAMDLLDDRSRQAAVEYLGADARLDFVVNTAGVLHDSNGLQPEKRLGEVSAANLARAFAINATASLMLAQSLEPLLRRSPQAVFATLSARVGSIGDNRSGGWYAYRASKAALNMIIRNLSIEWSRLKTPIVCVALHPGTVRTGLSAPFVEGRDGSGIFLPDEAAGHLLTVLDSLRPEDSGGFFAWDGKEIEW